MASSPETINLGDFLTRVYRIFEILDSYRNVPQVIPRGDTLVSIPPYSGWSGWRVGESAEKILPHDPRFITEFIRYYGDGPAIMQGPGRFEFIGNPGLHPTPLEEMAKIDRVTRIPRSIRLLRSLMKSPHLASLMKGSW